MIDSVELRGSRPRAPGAAPWKRVRPPAVIRASESVSGVQLIGGQHAEPELRLDVGGFSETS